MCMHIYAYGYVCQYAVGIVRPIALNENKALEMKESKELCKDKQSDAKSVSK